MSRTPMNDMISRNQNLPEGSITFLVAGFRQFTGATSDGSSAHVIPFADIIGSENGFLFNRTSETVLCSFSDTLNAINSAGKLLKFYDECGEACAEIELRIGIHCGTANWTGNNYDSYFSIARTHRIMTAANPGQSLISEEVLKTIGSSEDHSFVFEHLGEHFLKDLLKPASLYQINFPGLNHSFAPLTTLSCRPNNIPSQLNNLIGREELLDSIKNDLAESRLVTLTGTGGVGKTRLSLQIAAELTESFRNGLWFIELASVDSMGRAIQQLASVTGVSEDGEPDLLDAIIRDSVEKEILIILDNCEHLIRECAELADKILKGTKSVKILANSREALNLYGEVIRQVPSLKLPEINALDDISKSKENEAVRLFEERAKAVNSKFNITERNIRDIAEICVRLDGIPLAIELAAARTSAMSPDKILDKLHDRFRILSGGRRTLLPRQQTLRATIDWSYEHLDENEKDILKSLSIFEQNFSLESAESICSAGAIDEGDVLDLVAGLIDKSLLMKKETGSESRFFLLESIREYAREKLTTEEHDSLSEKLYVHFSEKIIRFTETGTGEVSLDVLAGLKQDHANILKTLEWAQEFKPSQFVRLTSMLEWYWDNSGYHNEAYSLLEKAVEADPADAAEFRGRALLSAGYFATNLCRYESAETHIKDAVEFFQDTGDESGRAECFNLLGILYTNMNEPEKARKTFEQCKNMSANFEDKNLYADSLANLSVIELKSGNYDEALKYSTEARDIYRMLNKNKALAKTLVNLGALEFYRQNLDESKKRYEEALGLLEGLGDVYTLCVNYINLGNIYFNQKQFEEAGMYYDKGFAIIREHEFVDLTGFMQLKSGDLALAVNDLDKAGQEYNKALDSPWIHNDKRKIASIFRGLGIIRKACGDFENALLFLLFSEKEFVSSGFRLPGFQEEELFKTIEELEGKFDKEKLEGIRTRAKELLEQEAIELHRNTLGDLERRPE